MPNIDDYILDTLMRDLVGHDHRPRRVSRLPVARVENSTARSWSAARFLP